MTIIGVDPHPGHHTAAAVDESGILRAARSFLNTPEEHEPFVTWVQSFPAPVLAVEGPTQPFFAPWTVVLQAANLRIVPIPPQRVAKARRRLGRGKNDEMDAQLIARVLLAEPELPALSLPRWLHLLQELVRTRLKLGQHRKAQRMAWRSATVPLVRATLKETVAALEEGIQKVDQEIAAWVEQLAPELVGLTGVGYLTAAILLAEVGDVRRFPTEDAFASYCGAAPLTWQSGASHIVRVNPGGNRRLNWVVHLVAMARKRVEPRSRALWERKVAEGKGKKGAWRVLKTYVARELYRHLRHLWTTSPVLSLAS